MDLIARYTRNGRTLDLQLVEVETQEVIHVVTDAEAEQENEALVHLGEAWAAQNGHRVVEVDSSDMG